MPASRSRAAFFLAFAVAAAAAVSAQAQPTKVGWVDTGVILSQYPRAQEAQRSLEATLQGFMAELQQLGTDMQSTLEEYDQQRMTMTPENRRAKEEEITTRQQAIEQRRQELDNQAQQRRAEVFQPVMESITAVIEEIRVEGNYAMILDAASQAILSADPSLELTQEVLNRLQAATGSGAPGTPGAPDGSSGRR